MKIGYTCLLASAIVAASPAAAAVYPTRAAFNAAVTSTTITFNDANTVEEYYPTTYSNSGVTFTSRDIFTVEPVSFAAGAAYGSDYLEWQPLTGEQLVTIALPTGINAIAFDFMELRALATTFTISVNGETFNLASGSSPSFFGYSSASNFSGLTITVPTDNPSSDFSNFPTIDNFSFGRTGVSGAVPEPATWAMMILGFGVVGGALRRHTRRTVVSYAA